MDMLRRIMCKIGLHHMVIFNSTIGKLCDTYKCLYCVHLKYKPKPYFLMGGYDE
jgi:hypothetical protein